MEVGLLRNEIERMRIQVGRQRKESSSISAPAFRPHRPRPCCSACW
jgi:hypothetical protein